MSGEGQGDGGGLAAELLAELAAAREEREAARAERAKLAETVGALAAAVTGSRAPPKPAPPPVTLLEVWPLYERAEKLSLASWRTVEHRWRLHVSRPFNEGPLQRCFAAMSPLDITLEMIDDYRAWRLTQPSGPGKDNRGVTRIATVNREIALLRRLLNFAVERKLLPYNPIRGVKQAALIKPENNVRQTVIEEFHPEAMVRLDDLLAKASPVMRAAILMSHGAGLRREEMTLARWDRLDMRTGILFVPDKDTKGGASGREVILSPEALQAICELPRDFRRRGGPILANPRTGEPYAPDYFSRRFRELCDDLKIKGPDGDVRFHDNRRSFVTLARRRGEDTTQLRQLTGHKTDSVFKRYNIFSRKDLLAAKKRMREAREQERAEWDDLKAETARAGERASAHKSPTVSAQSATERKKDLDG